MKEISKKKILEFIFYIGIMIELMIVILDKSAYIIRYEGQWFRLTFLLFAVKAFFNKYTRKEWLGLLAVGAIAVISYLVTGRNEMLRIVVLVAACKDIEPKRLLKTIFWFTLGGCVALMILALTGVFGTVAITAEFRVGKIETRYCFGLGHPNAFHCMVWVLVTLGCYIYKQKLKLWHYGLLFVANIIIYMFTLSRTAVLLTAMVIIAYAILNLWGKLAEYKWFYLLCAVMVIACVIVTILLCELWEHSSLVKEIDRKLSWRVMTVDFDENLQSYNARPSEWTLFAMEENTRFFDMGIARLFYWYGIIPGLVYILMNLHLIFIAYRRKDAFLSAVVATSMIYTIVEAHLISEYMLRNYLFILYGLAMTVPEDEKDNKQEYYLWDIRYIKRGLKRE